MENKTLSQLAADLTIEGDELLYLAQAGKPYKATVSQLESFFQERLRIGGAPIVIDAPLLDGDVLTLRQGVWNNLPSAALMDGGSF